MALTKRDKQLLAALALFAPSTAFTVYTCTPAPAAESVKLVTVLEPASVPSR